ncbi:MAG: TetR family transcriptional regulator [Bacillales bacterium]|jgi:TetR/AcrR family transcriptional repressor of nem operon|nr:TetR family transcriptional regulator [Bacillales bacterium]
MNVLKSKKHKSNKKEVAMARKREFDEDEALKQAMQLFWVQGYEKTSMEDLVNQMGVHRKSIYDTFGNKHELFIKALEHYKTSIGQQMLLYIANKESALDKMKALFDFSIRSNEELAKGCLVVNTAVELSLHDEVIAQIVRTNFNETEKVIYQLLQLGQTTGEFSSKLDLAVTTQFIHNALIGIRVQLKTTDGQPKLQPIIDMTLQVLKSTYN